MRFSSFFLRRNKRFAESELHAKSHLSAHKSVRSFISPFGGHKRRNTVITVADAKQFVRIKYFFLSLSSGARCEHNSFEASTLRREPIFHIIEYRLDMQCMRRSINEAKQM